MNNCVATAKSALKRRPCLSSLFLIVELIWAIFLKKPTPKDTTNSSLPASQTAKDESALGHAGSHGKGKRTQQERARNTRTVETVAVTTVDSCDRCGEPLSEVSCTGHERRTKIDLVFEKVVEPVDIVVRRSPRAPRSMTATFSHCRITDSTVPSLTRRLTQRISSPWGIVLK
ncbi:MAG: hypothetical protein ACRERU_13535 [Methylococcales bacterium]